MNHLSDVGIVKYGLLAFQNRVDCPHTTSWSKPTELWILVIFEISKLNIVPFSLKFGLWVFFWVPSRIFSKSIIIQLFQKQNRKLKLMSIILFLTAILVFSPIFHISTCELISICGYIIEYSTVPKYLIEKYGISAF